MSSLVSRQGSKRSIELPLLDISHETYETGAAIVAAAAKHGFFWVTASQPTSAVSPGQSESLDTATVDNMFEISRSFFATATTSEQGASNATNYNGFVGAHVENLDPENNARGDFKLAFNLSEPHFQTREWQQPLPPQLAGEDVALRDFHDRCRNVANRILRLIALGLGLDDIDWFVESHRKHSNMLRLLLYPELPQGVDSDSADYTRAGAHSDYGSLTLLFTRPDQPGLQILDAAGVWADVPGLPRDYVDTSFPPIIVNIGDIMSYWTSGLLRSAIHRVVWTGSEESVHGDEKPSHQSQTGCRYSIAVFVDPDEDAQLIPCPSDLVKASRATLGDMKVGRGGGAVSMDSMGLLTAGQYLAGRLTAAYVAA